MSNKNFKAGAAGAINPALAFITGLKEEEEQKRAAQQQEQEQPRAAQRPQPPETKSRRLQLLLKPSTYNAIKERADERYISVNEWINAALEAALREE